MNKINLKFIFSVLIISQTYSSYAVEKNLSDEIRKVMQMEHRNDKDKARDRNRSPVAALQFFGFKQDMKVIEFAPGNGWYTKILAPLLHDQGELHLAYKKEWLDEMDPMLKAKSLSRAIKMPIELEWNSEDYRYQLGQLDFGMDDADMVLSIREYHNFNAEDKIKLNTAAFNALKPGGKYIVVDHSRRHMQVETRELARREDPVKAIIEIQSAGFKLIDSSDMFYRPDDELRHEVGRKTVTGNTDRFSLVFIKPKK